MKLLLDQNVSPKLATRLGDLFPGSMSVHLAGLDRATDQELWEFAIHNGFAIVTKDEDFNNQSVLQGSPPKVIWLQLGNCTTDEIEAVFRRRFADIEAFDRDTTVGTLILS